jgi:hypothetical protein
MISLITTILAISLLAAMLLITVNYLPGWQSTSKQTSALVLNSFNDLRGAFASAWTADNVNSYKTGTYLDPPASGTGDGGLEANFGPYMYTPGAPAGYTWAYGHSSVNGLSYFCMYPTGSGANFGVFEGIKSAIRSFGGSSGQITLASGGSAACGSTSNSAPPASYPANYALTLFVHCSADPSPNYSSTGAVSCLLQ